MVHKMTNLKKDKRSYQRPTSTGFFYLHCYKRFNILSYVYLQGNPVYS